MSIGYENCPGCWYSGHSHLESCPESPHNKYRELGAKPSPDWIAKAAKDQQEKDRLIIGQIADWVCNRRWHIKNAQMGQLIIALTECIEVQSNEPFNSWLKSYNKDAAIERNAKP